MANDTDWLEYVRISITALTPIMTGLVGLIVLRMGTRLDTTKQLHQELLKKRLQLFEDVAPKLNDIFCFYQSIGHWAELSPEEVIRRKRAIDRVIQVNRYLFRSDFWEEYRRFEEAHFEMFTVAGQPARLRLDMEHVRRLVGGAFKNEWLSFVSSKTGNHEEQRKHYHALMEILGREVRGE